MHTPVLLQEAINGLKVKKDGLYIDASFGEGGHAIEIIKQGGRVLGIELDEKQYQISNIKYQKEISNIKNLKLVCGNFKNISKIAKENNFFPVDGILFDLGLSMAQIDSSGRGFSYKKLDQSLDMRIDLSQEETAESIVNSYSEGELYEIFAKYSEELNSRAVAQTIFFTRRVKKIKTVKDLINAIKKAIGKEDVRVYRRIFQALRITVNKELDNLRKGLQGSLEILKKDGRIAVISFHSLEDRIVKNFIRANQLKQLNKKIIRGGQNFRFERSAKLRIISFDNQ